MQQLNEDAWCSSGSLSVVRKNEAIFGTNEGNGTQVGQEEIQDHLNPSFSPINPFSYLSPPVQIHSGELDCLGAARAIWSLRGMEPGAVHDNEVGIPPYAGKVSRAGLGMAACVSYGA